MFNTDTWLIALSWPIQQREMLEQTMLHEHGGFPSSPREWRQKHRSGSSSKHINWKIWPTAQNWIATAGKKIVITDEDINRWKHTQHRSKRSGYTSNQWLPSQGWGGVGICSMGYLFISAYFFISCSENMFYNEKWRAWWSRAKLLELAHLNSEVHWLCAWANDLTSDYLSVQQPRWSAHVQKKVAAKKSKETDN